MRQYDVCRNANAVSRKRVLFVIVLQSDLMQDFKTVVVAPLVAETVATKLTKLNPVVIVQGRTYRVSMAEMSGVLRSQLGEAVVNAQNQHAEFIAAIDLLFTGI